jgi:ferritin-like metal-binding protein YciE
MATEDTRHRLLRYLNDAHAAEQGGLVALEHIAGEATSPELKNVIADHARVTRTQADRLAARIEALGGKVEAAKSAVNTLIATGSQFTNVFHDAADKRTQDVVKAYSLEHFEVGMYTALAAYAETIGDEETAWLARVIRGEEEQAGERLIALIPGLAASAVARTVEGKQAARSCRSKRFPLRPARRAGAKSRLPFWGAATAGVGLGALVIVRLLRSNNESEEHEVSQTAKTAALLTKLCFRAKTFPCPRPGATRPTTRSAARPTI